MKTKLLKKKDIVEAIDDPFINCKEAGIDSDNHILNSVCLFGPISKNDRVYLDKAIGSLTTLAEGSKCYANHPGKSELKERDGVRDIRDWVGVFEGARRDGNKIYANLKVREAYWDLMSDIAMLQPTGMGMSINAMVKVHQDDATGLENVMDVMKLRSVDAVASAATTSSLWESARDKVEKEEENVLSAYESTVPYIVEQKFMTLIIEEGLIQDKLDNEKLQQEISNVTYLANDLIRDTIYNSKLSIAERKKKVIDIFDDLSKEIKKRISKLKTNVEEDLKEMDFNINDVKENREVMEALLKEFEEKLSVNKTLEKVKVLEGEIVELKSSLEEKDKTIKDAGKGKETLESEKDEEIKTLTEKVTTLESDLNDSKLKLDEIAVVEKQNEKKILINGIVSKSDLPKDAVTDLFMTTLMAVEADAEDVKDAKTVEEKIKEYIEDRMIGIDKKKEKKTVVKGSGDEFVAKTESEKKEPITKEKLESAKDDFMHASK